MATYYSYTSPPPAYTQFACPSSPIKIIQHTQPPKYPSSTPVHASVDPLRDARDKAKYRKSRDHAKAIYAAASRKDFLPCPHTGCKNVTNNIDSLIVELQMHEVANSGVMCPTCANWFEHWDVMERHMCPGPGRHVQAEDPYESPCAPPIQSLAKVDPCFFHQSMPRQQYAIVAARRAVETRRKTPAGHGLRCDFYTCPQLLPSETTLAEHLFQHFTTASGGQCPSCKHWCASVRDRDAHNCSQFGHSHSETYFGYDSDWDMDSDFDDQDSGSEDVSSSGSGSGYYDDEECGDSSDDDMYDSDEDETEDEDDYSPR